MAYQKIVDSVQNAVSRKKLQAAAVVHEPSPKNAGAAATIEKDDSIDEKFRNAVLAKYESIEHAWHAFDCLSAPKSQLTRADFKGLLDTVIDMYLNSDKTSLVYVCSGLGDDWIETQKQREGHTSQKDGQA